MFFLPDITPAQPPHWVGSFPTSKEDYIGIGIADKLNYPYKYKDIAREKALTQISREISMHIQSRSTLVRQEDSMGYDESWSGVINSSSSNDLWGYELVDTWQTPLEYWAYYKLDKEKYRTYLANRFIMQEAGLKTYTKRNSKGPSQIFTRPIKFLKTWRGAKIP